jgi:HAD superfamily hydrolase (TIGR01509 family)
VIPRFSLYLFDVDGTLVDSATDICGAIREALSGTPQAGCEESLLRSYIGRHLFELIDRLFPDYTPEQMEALMADYRRIYLSRGHTRTRVYPGVLEALATLPGNKATATTKGTPTTRAVLEMFGLLPYFHHVQGTDGFPAKPAPDVILKSLEQFRVSPDEVLMVGDSPADMEAGHRAGVRTCAVRYGYGKEPDLARHEPDYWIDDLRQLTALSSY